MRKLLFNIKNNIWTTILTCLIIALLVATIIISTGCSSSQTTHGGIKQDTGLFVVVESWDNGSHKVYVNKETKVMYFYSYHGGTVVMLNDDGTPQTWNGELPE